MKTDSTIIDIVGFKVPIVKGGLYDRFRSNPPLSVIAAHAPDIDLSWFEKLTKKKVDIGFESYSPNFYYKNSSITAIFTADLSRLQELIPPAILAQVSPISLFPKRGLIAITAYRYHYCDNDAYNEFSLSIVTKKPKSSNCGILSLMKQSSLKQFWGYVLKLPVNTELARVRGVVGYNLPKWLTPINHIETNDLLKFELIDSETGKVDITFEGIKLTKFSNDKEISRYNFINLNQQNRLTHGYTDSRPIKKASSFKNKSVNLILTDGSLSTFIESLKLGRMIKYEYVPEFQCALYAPQLL